MSKVTLARLPSGSRVLLAVAERLGDCLFRQPAVNLLARAYPELRFDVLTFGPAGAAVFANNPTVGKVHCTADRKAILALARDYALLVNLRGTNIKTYMRGVKLPILRFRGRTTDGHKTQDGLNFASSLLPPGFSVTDEDRAYRLYPRPEDFARADELLGPISNLKSQISNLFIGLHLGCASLGRYRLLFALQKRWTHRKVWPVDRYAELAARLVELDPRVRIVLVGTAEERFLARDFVRRVPGVIDLTGKLSVQELAAVMTRLRLFICNDTGPMHIACAMRTPLIGLFGPTQSHRTGPYPALPQFQVIQESKMRRIEVEKVFERARPMLTDPRP